LQKLQRGQENSKIERLEQMEQGIISQARIICTTLSTGANKILEKFKNKIEYLIIDEAC
jgi:superfamily I DNA and/or RNA helicase